MELIPIHSNPKVGIIVQIHNHVEMEQAIEMMESSTVRMAMSHRNIETTKLKYEYNSVMRYIFDVYEEINE